MNKEEKKSVEVKKQVKKEENEFPMELKCPITQEVMKDPVVAMDGHSYERKAIEEWFERGVISSPLTGSLLNSNTIVENHSLRQVIEKLREHVPKLQQDLEEISCLRLKLENKEEEIKNHISESLSIISLLDWNFLSQSTNNQFQNNNERNDNHQDTQINEETKQQINNNNNIIEKETSSQITSFEEIKSYLIHNIPTTSSIPTSIPTTIVEETIPDVMIEQTKSNLLIRRNSLEKCLIGNEEEQMKLKNDIFECHKELDLSKQSLTNNKDLLKQYQEHLYNHQHNTK